MYIITAVCSGLHVLAVEWFARSVYLLFRALLRGHSRGPDTIRVNESGTASVTYDSKGRDVALWLWDLEQGESHVFFSHKILPTNFT
jgi:hypothetical protein